MTYEEYTKLDKKYWDKLNAISMARNDILKEFIKTNIPEGLDVGDKVSVKSGKHENVGFIIGFEKYKDKVIPIIRKSKKDNRDNFFNIYFNYGVWAAGRFRK